MMAGNAFKAVSLAIERILSIVGVRDAGAQFRPCRSELAERSNKSDAKLRYFTRRESSSFKEGVFQGSFCRTMKKRKSFR